VARKVIEKLSIEEELHLLLKQWQVRLRLQDWAVTLDLSRGLESFGQAATNAALKEATIVLRDPRTIPEQEWAGCTDTEVTLVHELLHLFTASFDGKLKQLEMMGVENMVELTAQALVAAKRGLLTMHPEVVKA
jgi:hypothetical protein